MLYIKYSVSRFLTLPLLWSLILFYHSVIIGLFVDLHLKVSYAITFSLFFITIFYKNYSINTYNWLVIAFSFLFAPLIVGIIYNWDAIDMLADYVRYLAPFIGFASATILFKRVEFTDFVSFLYLFGFAHLFFYYVSVFNKIVSVISDWNIVEYASNGLGVNSFYFALFYFSLQKKIVSHKATYLLIIGYLIGYVANPILLMSKARLLDVIIVFTIIFVFYSNYKEKIKIILLTMAAGFILIISYLENDKIFSRISNAYYSVINDDYNMDASTSFRLKEISNIHQTLMDDPIKRLPLGLGLGALYYDSYDKILGGVHKENFRSDGGIHHVFMAYYAYTLRYGLIGLSILLIWLYSIKIKLSENTNNSSIIYIVNSSLKIFIATSLVYDIFVPVHIYGNFSFGFLLAIGVMMSSKYKNGMHNIVDTL